MTAARKAPEDRRRKREPFRYVIDGVDYELRSPSFGQLADLQAADNETLGVLDLLAGCTSEAGYAAIRSLDAQDVNDLFSDWLAAVGGGTPGESSGSAA